MPKYPSCRKVSMELEFLIYLSTKPEDYAVKCRLYNEDWPSSEDEIGILVAEATVEGSVLAGRPAPACSNPSSPLYGDPGDDPEVEIDAISVTGAFIYDDEGDRVEDGPLSMDRVKMMTHLIDSTITKDRDQREKIEDLFFNKAQRESMDDAEDAACRKAEEDIERSFD